MSFPKFPTLIDSDISEINRSPLLDPDSTRVCRPRIGCLESSKTSPNPSSGHSASESSIATKGTSPTAIKRRGSEWKKHRQNEMVMRESLAGPGPGSTISKRVEEQEIPTSVSAIRDKAEIPSSDIETAPPPGFAAIRNNPPASSESTVFENSSMVWGSGSNIVRDAPRKGDWASSCRKNQTSRARNNPASKKRKRRNRRSRSFDQSLLPKRKHIGPVVQHRNVSTNVAPTTIVTGHGLASGTDAELRGKMIEDKESMDKTKNRILKPAEESRADNLVHAPFVTKPSEVFNADGTAISFGEGEAGDLSYHPGILVAIEENVRHPGQQLYLVQFFDGNMNPFAVPSVLVLRLFDAIKLHKKYGKEIFDLEYLPMEYSKFWNKDLDGELGDLKRYFVGETIEEKDKRLELNCVVVAPENLSVKDNKNLVLYWGQVVAKRNVGEKTTYYMIKFLGRKASKKNTFITAKHIHRMEEVLTCRDEDWIARTLSGVRNNQLPKEYLEAWGGSTGVPVPDNIAIKYFN